VRLAPWRNVLQDLQPDLIEVGDPYLTAWAALDARRQLDVPVIGFYHSDLPLLVSNRMGHWVTPNVEAYVSKLYGNFDRVLAPSQVMADKLRGLGCATCSCSRWGWICKLSILAPATRVCAPNWALPKTPVC
jgi:alpha-1,6-mannosyltransferase